VAVANPRNQLLEEEPSLNTHRKPESVIDTTVYKGMRQLTLDRTDFIRMMNR